ncbi:MAG: AI-2E family transporter [Methylococcales bacterium]|nr:AI-2E family transporter [Methylococcales bacterium]
MQNSFSNTPMRQLIPGILLAVLLLLSYRVLQEFLLTLTWAFIIAYVMWPMYRWLKRHCNGRQTLSALVMTAVITLAILLMVYWFAELLEGELSHVYQNLVEYITHKPYRLPESVQRIPWLGHYSETWLERLNHDQDGVTQTFLNEIKQWLGKFAQLLGGVGRNIVKLGIILVTVFFCFRDGEEAIKQLQLGLIHFLGTYQAIYLQAAGDTTRAVVYGLVLAAIGQGLLAGVGYAFVGIQAPVLFGVITALLALIPMGATLVWLPIAVSLILSDQLWPGIGLLLWGFFAVSTVDNVIRPIVISGASQVPFLLVMLGVLGGLSTFGAVGLFLGPVILSVLLAVWQAWLKLQEQNLPQ